MTRGKQTCRILKEIRRQIAEANQIELVTEECRYKGDCRGTCPRCEAEVRYLEQQLRARQLMGKAVALAGLSAGMIAFSGCGSSSDQPTDNSDTLQSEPKELLTETPPAEDELIEGEAPAEEIKSVKSVFDISRASDDTAIQPSPSDDVSSEIMGKVYVGPSDGTIYRAVEQMPEFPGGDAAMNRFVANNLNYPKAQLEAGIQGLVIVQFYIDTLGNVCEPSIIRGVDPALDLEAIRLVKSFPKFIPGKTNGKKAKVWWIQPIRFTLPSE